MAGPLAANRAILSARRRAEVTVGLGRQPEVLRDRKADLAFTTGEMPVGTINGTGPFERTKVPFRTLAVLYVNYTDVVTLASSPIWTLGELTGKMVSTGFPRQPGEVTAFRCIWLLGPPVACPHTP